MDFRRGRVKEFNKKLEPNCALKTRISLSIITLEEEYRYNQRRIGEESRDYEALVVECIIITVVVIT